MATDNSLNIHQSIKLARNPGNWFCFFVSLTVGLAFAFMCNQQSLLVLSSVASFPIIIYIQKRNTGLWPFGFTPFIGPVDSFP